MSAFLTELPSARPAPFANSLYFQHPENLAQNLLAWMSGTPPAKNNAHRQVTGPWSTIAVSAFVPARFPCKSSRLFSHFAGARLWNRNDRSSGCRRIQAKTRYRHHSHPSGRVYRLISTQNRWPSCRTGGGWRRQPPDKGQRPHHRNLQRALGKEGGTGAVSI